MKKILLAILLAAGLIFGPINGAAHAYDKGFSHSWKSLEVQWIQDEAKKEPKLQWVQIEDGQRLAERIRDIKAENNIPNDAPLTVQMILGQAIDQQGHYMVYMQMGFYSFPIGVMDWPGIVKHYIPDYPELAKIRPARFQTAAGFEDIWFYMECGKKDLDFGKAYINGNFNGYTVEQPWNYNRPYKSCVPVGDYE